MSESLVVLRFLSRCRFGVEENHPQERKTKSKRLFHIIQKSRPAAKSVSPTPLSTPVVPFPHTPAAREPNRCVNAGGYVLFLSAEME